MIIMIIFFALSPYSTIKHPWEVLDKTSPIHGDSTPLPTATKILGVMFCVIMLWLTDVL